MCRFRDHLIGRLRHKVMADVIAGAVENGVLRARTFEHNGHRCLSFHPSAGAGRMNSQEIIDTVSRPIDFGIKGRHRFIYKDGEITVDESLPNVRIKYSGAKEIRISGTLEPDCEALHPDESQAHRWRMPSLIKLFEKRLVRPSAADVGTLLLLAEGIQRQKKSPSELARAFKKRRRSITIITCPVSGVEDQIIALLRQGLILPGESIVSVAGDLTSQSELRAALRRGARRHVSVIPSTVFAENPYCLSTAADEALPILCFSDSDECVSASISAASNVRIKCGYLTRQILEETIRIVTGTKPPALVELDATCINLDDLEIAVGPGNTAAEAARFLRNLAQARSGSSRSDRNGPKRLKSGSEIIDPIHRSQSTGFPLLEDMSGYPAVLIDWASSLKQDLEMWRAGRLPWEEVSSRLLLSGPPGTGKTLFAQALANTLQLRLIRTSVASWLNGGHLNTVIKRMTDCFDEARSHAPTILFIDEIDGIGTRDSENKDYSDYWITVVNKLLESLNWVHQMEGLIVLGATNRPEAIDSALLRSGRLQPQIEIGLPDTSGLAGILRHSLGSDAGPVVESAPRFRLSGCGAFT